MLSFKFNNDRMTFDVISIIPYITNNVTKYFSKVARDIIINKIIYFYSKWPFSIYPSALEVLQQMKHFLGDGYIS